MAGLWGLVKRFSNRGDVYRLQESLLRHLASIGVAAEPEENAITASKSARDSLRGAQPPASIAVGLRNIDIIKVTWEESYEFEKRVLRLSAPSPGGRQDSRMYDGLREVKGHYVTYRVAMESGLLLPEVEAKALVERTFWGRVDSFEWSGVPTLVEKLKSDGALRKRLLERLSTELPHDLRIRRLPGQRVGITTSFRLPSRSTLACMEDLAGYVHDYVVEMNRAYGSRSV